MGKGGIITAWLFGLGIIAWRDIRVNHGPPIPAQFLGASGLFALLALVAEYPSATVAATAAAWGFDIAALLAPGVIPSLLGGTGGQAAGGHAGAAAPAAKGPRTGGAP
jgi:hypothetical protein